MCGMPLAIRCVVYGTRVALIFMPFTMVINWVVAKPFSLYPFSEQILRVPGGAVALRDVTWTAGAHILGCLATIIQNLPVFIGLWMIHTMFTRFSRGDILVRDNARSCYRLSWCFIASVLLRPFSEALMTLAATLNNPVGQRCMSVSLGSQHFTDMLCAVFLLIVASIIKEAACLDEDRQLTV